MFLKNAFLSFIFISFFYPVLGSKGSPSSLDIPTSSSSSSDSSSPSLNPLKEEKKYKIGLELQEISHLVSLKGAGGESLFHDRNFQSKEIFRISQKNSHRRFIKVEIDGKDIEFITDPFSNLESEMLMQAVGLIRTSLKCLKDLFSDVCEPYEKKLRAQNNIDFYLEKINLGDELDLAECEKYNDSIQIFNNPIDPNYPTFERWFEKIQATLSENSENFEIIPGKIYEQAKIIQIFIEDVKEPKEMWHSEGDVTKYEKSFIKEYQNWKPRFQPQLTVQYPIEWTIPFLFDVFKDKQEVIASFLNYLPFPDAPHNSQNPKYLDKRMGFMFLHGATMYHLTPSPHLSEGDLIKDLHNMHSNYGQTNAKRSLPIVVRRPFSEIERGMRDHDGVEYKGEDLEKNPFFAPFVPTNFYKVNYAKKFDVNISDLIGRINNLPQDKVRYLLGYNLLSTGMLRTITPKIHASLADGNDISVNKIFSKFYKDSLSINKPKHDRFDVDMRGGFPIIERTEVDYDPLSPPWFSPGSDSMGYFKREILTDYPLLDLEYGEAFIELRWFNKIFPSRYDFLKNNFLEDILNKILSVLNGMNKQEFST